MGGLGIANAQKAPSFGIKGGVNFATVTGGDFDSPDARTSFHVGVLGEMPVTNMFSLQAEVLYSGQGFEYDFEGPDGDKAEYQLNYINVPVLAKFYLFDGFSIEAGPQFGFVVSEELDLNPYSDDGDIELSGSPAEAKNFEFGVAAGVTFETPIGLFASGRYNMGVTDIIEDVDAQNSVFQIGVGYKF